MKEIKWILISISILIITILFGVNSCSRKKYAEQQVVIAELNLKNDIQQNQIKLRDSMIKAKDLKIGIVEANLKISESELNRLRSKYVVLQGDYNDLSGKLINVTLDSSYRFLISTAYPFDGELKYLFNGPQIKGFHLTFLQKAQLDKINGNLLGQIQNCESRVIKKDSIISLKNDKIEYLNQTRNALDSIILNDTAIIELKDKQIKKANRKKNFWKIFSLFIGGIAVGTNL